MTVASFQSEARQGRGPAPCVPYGEQLAGAVAVPPTYERTQPRNCGAVAELRQRRRRIDRCLRVDVLKAMLRSSPVNHREQRYGSRFAT